ncbi:hypothetical protein IMSHALPRED_003861 [Imshaugia aleurites]|uniref:Uncharacterized protein n=1 Tax=Imshaugia aleurites TaxID=172621 RepID=A0A8H3J8C0_9LECA|nr:hypothetical protein IMSHALPRED_003861 [Imshaugia aleurites]
MNKKVAETINHSITVNCGTLNAASSVNCVYTTIYNKESPHDQSIISPTYVSRTTTIAQSSLYPFTFTNVTVSATAAATPQNSLATPTTPPNNIPTTISPSSTSTTSTSPSKAPPTTLPPHPHSPPLTPGAKAGIGISVPLGILALCGLGLLLYRHKRHKENSRASQTENFLQAEGYVAENEGKDVPAPDNSGVYEMQERGSLDRGGVHELG